MCVWLLRRLPCVFKVAPVQIITGNAQRFRKFPLPLVSVWRLPPHETVRDFIS